MSLNINAEATNIGKCHYTALSLLKYIVEHQLTLMATATDVQVRTHCVFKTALSNLFPPPKAAKPLFMLEKWKI